MHKICFTISFISCLYMFRAHVLETCRGMSDMLYGLKENITDIRGSHFILTGAECNSHYNRKTNYTVGRRRELKRHLTDRYYIEWRLIPLTNLRETSYTVWRGTHGNRFINWWDIRIGSDSLSLWAVLTDWGVDIIYFTRISGEDSWYPVWRRRAIPVEMYRTYLTHKCGSALVTLPRTVTP